MAKKVLMTANGDEVSRNIAIQLAKHGCRLVLMGNEASLRSTVDYIRVSVDGAFPVELIGADMEADSEEAFYVAVQKAWTRLGSLDAFVNCCTYQGKMQDILRVSEDEFKKITKINLTAPWFILKAVASMMKENGTGGSIVFLATIASGERGLYPGADAYATAAAAIHQLVRASAMSLGKHKIRVNMISRGLHLGDEYPVSVGIDRAQKLVKDAAPLGQWLNPEKDIYSTVIYLISDGSCFMTGTTVMVDGAQSLTRPRLKSYM
ncbi:carbonyl reductase [NADPH] 2 [Brassica rapa]|uniref:3-oxoacyl-[acyl-carrier-protein] reductase n=1 Tax=Brassica campestris TaxID=3711 RepID=M4EQ93_BRACM|nr:carbonyl reductase [NADPH] 2 [Brassica rapa]